MRISKLAIGVVAGMGMLSFGASVYWAAFERQKIVQVRAALLESEGDVFRVQSGLADASRRFAEAEKDRADLEEIARGLSQRARDAKKQQASATSDGTGPDLKTLAKNPAFEAAYLSNHRAWLPLEYAALYRQLGLTPDQIHRFEEVMASHRQADFDVAASAADQGMSWQDPSLSDLYAKNRTDLAADLQGIVTVQQLSDYSHGQPARNVAVQLAAALNYSDASLTPQQSASMVQLITAHTNGGAIDWGSVMAQAPGVLSPSQISMLGSVQARIQYNRAAGNGSPRIP